MKSLVVKIAEDLQLNPTYIANIISNSQYLYRGYYIPKKDGGKRFIQQPSSELKTLQYWVVQNILGKMPVSDAATAYMKGSTIKKNALLHCNKSFILHTDIVDFFHNIKRKLFEVVLLQYSKSIPILSEYDDSVEVILNICFFKDHACIGAVSSPAISNIVLFSFDEELKSFANNNNLTYSRYADDIYISSHSYISPPVISIVKEKLKNSGFTINTKKTYFLSRKVRLCVTGLTIFDKKHVTISKKLKLNIRKLLYDKLIHNTGSSDVILGYLSFIKDIDVGYYNLLLTKYSTYCTGDIIQELRKSK